MKRWTAALSAVLMSGLTLMTGLMHGEVAQASAYSLSTKQIVWGGKTVSSPEGIAAIDPSTHKLTTYMPIWYVMQALQSVGITSGWDGTNWTMEMPYGDTPSVDLHTVNAGSGSKHFYINGVNVQNVGGIVYQDPASKQETTYIPVWYVMKVLGYENIVSHWSGAVWSLTPGPVPFSENAAAEPSSVAAGVIPGAASSTGGTMESWQNSGQDVSIDNLSYNGAGNVLPIQGHVNGSHVGDIVVEVYAADSENWFYSVPVDSAGNFSSTIVLPYHGTNYVTVGDASFASDSFGLSQSAAYGEFNNLRPTLGPAQLALLQSWMVNYNDAASVHNLAVKITASAQTKDQAIRLVSNWVSQNVDYNFPELNQNQFVWQQATQTLNKGYGVCQDQAAVAAALLRSLDIPTEVIGGEAYDPTTHQDLGTHAWNKAWDGIQWITFDACWDQNYTQTTSIAPPASISDDYFNIPAELFNRSHVPDPTDPFGWAANPRV
ncbi:transglutaminase domain-containing protein [Alicyclobacillus ferrooxydans]|uniref:transglutaminase domain-containing protein n=1 Tax=Alicyclobacillus ferrooxydans TaxID=471514 RepID=UPI00146FE3EE|nr:transglutaminase domain-containing protein [Alicyclobacillus ferrooxydans]